MYWQIYCHYCPTYRPVFKLKITHFATKFVTMGSPNIYNLRLMVLIYNEKSFDDRLFCSPGTDICKTMNCKNCIQMVTWTIRILPPFLTFYVHWLNWTLHTIIDEVELLYDVVHTLMCHFSHNTMLIGHCLVTAGHRVWGPTNCHCW